MNEFDDCDKTCTVCNHTYSTNQSFNKHLTTDKHRQNLQEKMDRRCIIRNHAHSTNQSYNNHLTNIKKTNKYYVTNVYISKNYY